MGAVLVILANIVSIVLVIAGIGQSGERAQVLLYAFILDCILRLFTIAAITGVLHRRPAGRLAWVASTVSSLPAPGQVSSPIIEEESRRPLGFSGYVVVVAFLAVLTFVLGTVNAERGLDLDFATWLQDLRWAIGVALLYWIQSLASRKAIVDPAASREVNFGYNTRDLTILALSTLTAAAVVVVRQARDLPASGWTVLGPLLAFRFLYDVATGLQLARRRSLGMP